MTDAELLAAYQPCRIAVAFTELIICRDDPGRQTSWDLMMSAKTPLSLDEVIEMIQGVMEEEAEETGACRAEEAYEQSKHPMYRTYIAAKMGMM